MSGCRRRSPEKTSHAHRRQSAALGSGAPSRGSHSWSRHRRRTRRIQYRRKHSAPRSDGPLGYGYSSHPRPLAAEPGTSSRRPEPSTLGLVRPAPRPRRSRFTDGRNPGFARFSLPAPDFCRAFVITVTSPALRLRGSAVQCIERVGICGIATSTCTSARATRAPLPALLQLFPGRYEGSSQQFPAARPQSATRQRRPGPSQRLRTAARAWASSTAHAKFDELRHRGPPDFPQADLQPPRGCGGGFAGPGIWQDLPGGRNWLTPRGIASWVAGRRQNPLKLAHPSDAHAIWTARSSTRHRTAWCQGVSRRTDGSPGALFRAVRASSPTVLLSHTRHYDR